MVLELERQPRIVEQFRANIRDNWEAMYKAIFEGATNYKPIDGVNQADIAAMEAAEISRYIECMAKGIPHTTALKHARRRRMRVRRMLGYDQGKTL